MNHIHLMWGYFDELKDIAMAQRLIDIARGVNPSNQELQLALDRKQTELNARKDHIHELMFEISRNN
jgi:hypothetical protein